MKKKKLKESVIIIDMNNRCHAAYHAHKRLSFKGESVSIIYGLPSMIKGLIWRERPDMVISVWDGDRSKHRIKALPGYKAHRNKNPRLFDREDFERQKAIVMKMFYYLGIPQVRNKAVEGDDMIYKMVRWAKKRFKQITIVSGDKDFNQLIDKKVSIWNDAKQNMIIEKNCFDYFGYHPHETVDYITLVGDDSDDIPGYRGIGPKKAREVLDTYGTLEDFLDSKDKHPIINRGTLLEIKNRNQYLIDLPYFYSKHKDEIKVKFYKGESNPSLNKEAFKRICGKFGLRKFLGNQFLEEFVELKLSQD
jgi:DNA polymerase I